MALKREFIVRQFDNGAYEIICSTSGLKKTRYANGDSIYSIGSNRVIHYLTHDAKVWTEDAPEIRKALKDFDTMYVRYGCVY